MGYLSDRSGMRKPFILGPKTNAFVPKGNYESVSSQGSSSNLKSEETPDPHKYRLRTGDD